MPHTHTHTYIHTYIHTHTHTHTHITWVQKFFINSLWQHSRQQDHWMLTSSCYITTTLLL